MHRLLERQLAEHLPAATEAPSWLQPLLDAVDRAYRESDDDRHLLERSIERSAKELLERNRQLANELAERKQLEIGLRQAQKLEAVGQLASGIAHEINTPVQFIGDSLSFLRTCLDDLAPLIGRYRALVDLPGLAENARAEVRAAEAAIGLDELLGEMPGAADRALEGLARVAAIVRAMKEFGHCDSLRKAPADLNRGLQSTLVVAHNELKYVADVETSFEELPPVRCHLGDLNQVFLNLLVNAAHAVADTGTRGKVTVSSRAEPGAVVIAIGDTGGGIPDALHQRMFEPFFTTKDVGRGSGQGLAIARSIVVDKHGGDIWFDTTVGVGTTFFIRLPTGESPADALWAPGACTTATP